MKNPIFNKIIQINKKSDEIEQLKKEKEILIKVTKKKCLGDEKKLRQKYLTNELSKNDKITFYKATIEGNLELYKMCVNGTEKHKSFNIFEEVSAPGNYWTTFHYAFFMVNGI